MTAVHRPRTPRPPPDAGWADRLDLGILLALPALTVLIVSAVTPPEALPLTHPDVLYYFRVAGQVAGGQVPYVDFPFEYPPLGLAPIVAPYLAWPPGSPALLDYKWLLALQNAALAAIVAGLVGWLAARADAGLVPARVLATWALVALIQAPLVAWRYDILAVALAVGGVALLVAGRPGWAGVLLALGAWVKIFPIALVPILIAWLLTRGDRAGTGRLLAGTAVTGLVVAAVAAMTVGLGPALSFVSYQQDRLVQAESVAASAALALHLLVGLPVSVGFGFQSLQVSAPGLDVVLELETILLVAGVAIVSSLGALRLRSERRVLGSPQLPTLFAYLVAVVIALLATNKVFSAQYVLWLLPFGCLLPRPQTGVVVAVAALSILVFPLSYGDLIDLEPLAIGLLVARNTLLLGLLGWVLVRYRPSAVRIAFTPAAPAVSDRTS